jgi:hypothetical protein
MPREKSPAPAVRKRAPRKPSGAAGSKISAVRFVDHGQRSALIAEAAFFLAERRGFAPGHEVEDWLAAESEVDARLLHAAESGPHG